MNKLSLLLPFTISLCLLSGCEKPEHATASATYETAILAEMQNAELIDDEKKIINNGARHYARFHPVKDGEAVSVKQLAEAAFIPKPMAESGVSGYQVVLTGREGVTDISLGELTITDDAGHIHYTASDFTPAPPFPGVPAS